MKIEIYYCAVWNYRPHAAGLAAELKHELGVDAQLVASDNGIFDVIVDGEKIFSRYDSGRFPAAGELITLLSNKKAE